MSEEFPVDIQRNNNVIMTSKRRRDVVLTSQWRYYCVVCPLGCDIFVWNSNHTQRTSIGAFAVCLHTRQDVLFYRPHNLWYHIFSNENILIWCEVGHKSIIGYKGRLGVPPHVTLSNKTSFLWGIEFCCHLFSRISIIFFNITGQGRI